MEVFESFLQNESAEVGPQQEVFEAAFFHSYFYYCAQHEAHTLL